MMAVMFVWDKTHLPLEEKGIVDDTYKIDFIPEGGTYDEFLSGLTYLYNYLTEELTPLENMYIAG